LDPRALAEEHGIPVVTIDELAAHTRRAGTVAHLLEGGGADAISAFTVCHGPRRLIAVNPSHTPGRQASSVAHELSHILLEHDPDQALPDDGVLTGRTWSPLMEREAGWCGGVLLVPRPAALRFARNPARRAALRQEYGVSEEMIDFRLKVTGAIRQVG
jgi:Zn-dependent peptidase ImmA (M78 family)